MAGLPLQVFMQWSGNRLRSGQRLITLQKTPAKIRFEVEDFGQHGEFVS